MATVTITIPDAQLPRFRDAFCAYIGLTAPADVTNANARLGLVQAAKNIVRNYETAQAEAAALAAVTDPPDVT